MGRTVETNVNTIRKEIHKKKSRKMAVVAVEAEE